MVIQPVRGLRARPNDRRSCTFDWHGEAITRATSVTRSYCNTQNVRRFLRAECGAGFKFDQPFMQWIKDGTPKTMGDVADAWLRRRRAGRR
jgi:uncharacterized protein DUF6434